MLLADILSASAVRRARAIGMGWTRGVLTDDVPLRLDTHESDLHFDLLEGIAGPVKGDYATHMTALGAEVPAKLSLRARGYVAIQLAAANATPPPTLWPRDLSQSPRQPKG